MKEVLLFIRSELTTTVYYHWQVKKSVVFLFQVFLYLVMGREGFFPGLEQFFKWEVIIA